MMPQVELLVTEKSIDWSAYENEMCMHICSRYHSRLICMPFCVLSEVFVQSAVS